MPHVAVTPEEVRSCGGSFYNQTLALGHLDLAGYDLPPSPRLALVGTPCEVQGLRAMQSRPWTRWGASQVDAVVLAIALLCTKSFNYDALMFRDLRDRRGVRPRSRRRVDVIRGKLIVEDRQGATIIEEPIRDFHGAALKGCDECADFLGYGADISVGSVGSAEGYSSVLVRTPAGRHAFAQVRDRLELRPVDDQSRLLKLQATDRRIALESLRRPLDPERATVHRLRRARPPVSGQRPSAGETRPVRTTAAIATTSPALLSSVPEPMDLKAALRSAGRAGSRQRYRVAGLP